MGSPMPSRRISLFSLPPSPLILANRSAASVASSTGGSRTHRRSRRFELRRFSVCVPCQIVVEASPMGFEPTISCVTGRRALRCSTRTCCFASGSGGSRTHSIPATNLRSVPEPRWSASCLPSRIYAQSEIRTHKHSATNAARRCPSRAALPIGASGPE